MSEAMHLSTVRASPLVVPLPAHSRAVVEVVSPVVDGGAFAAKGSLGEPVVVLADVFGDGHDEVDASLWVRGPGRAWSEVPMSSLGNDRWRVEFEPDAIGRWEFRVSGWSAHFATWAHDVAIKSQAGVELTTDLMEGATMLRALEALSTQEQALVDRAVDDLLAGRLGNWPRDDELATVVRRHEQREPDASSPPLPLQVDRALARFSAWYELFPRSTVDGSDRHATLADAIDRLPYVAGLGFDIVYLPPIHPIGRQFRKGPNNAPVGGPDDDGSPWAIGAVEGGHTAVHPQLGTVEDVRRLARAAEGHGIALAIDIAFQASPDHPWVTEHPEWFRKRADGTIRCAENPPKVYQDVYPFDFESPAWPELWHALLGVFTFWLDQGVRVFRVDNPHTKPFAFWEWCIGELRHHAPDVIVLSEAFTRPRVMERLAKLGFSQSYTYFAWRQGREELAEYFTELTTRTAPFMRPNAWPNTPDILTAQLQAGGRPMSALRAVLASTLSASWGIYGPAFELVDVHTARAGSEDYLDSEKYQRRQWDLDAPGSLAPLITALNQARRRHRSLQHDRNLQFHLTDNEQLMCYSKRSPDGGDAVLVVVNLDPDGAQQGWLDVDLAALGLPYGSRYRVHDELGGGTYDWSGNAGWVRLDPAVAPAHVFAIEAIGEQP